VREEVMTTNGVGSRPRPAKPVVIKIGILN